MAQKGVNVLSAVRTLHALDNPAINNWRVILMRQAIDKAKFDARARAMRQVSPYSPGKVSGKLTDSIKQQIYMRDGNKTLVGELYVLRNRLKTENGGDYGTYQEYGTGIYHGKGYIKPKNKKRMMWVQTIRWRLGGTNPNRYKWRQRDKGVVGRPYKGKSVHPRYVGAVVTRRTGRSTQTRMDISEQWQIYAQRVRGVKPKRYLRDAMASSNPIWKKFKSDVALHLTRDLFPRFISNVPTSWQARWEKYKGYRSD